MPRVVVMMYVIDNCLSHEVVPANCNYEEYEIEYLNLTKYIIIM